SHRSPSRSQKESRVTKTIAVCVLALVIQVFVVSRATAEMFLWAFKTSAVADPPSMSDVQIQAPHLEGDRSGDATICLVPTNGLPGAWTGPFAGPARVFALGFSAGNFPEPNRTGEIHGGYHLTASLRDEASHAIGALTFAGRFDGVVGTFPAG